ncbi:WD repeat-containing protein 3 [Caerostris extrusa]|uniref:WD repeat-containing protein 3 n=1 Tax=Caerostris extrusa TaxID=172846 RepID=A0AAV4UJE9_CAEEX|nr:WD repeat-containing protein 3 [Caerostris extrusa]
MTTTQYLKFCPGKIFGIVASSSAAIVPVNLNERINLKDNFFAVPACENVYIWNLRTKEKTLVLNGENSIVTCLIADSNHKNIAVGYADGTVRIFSIQDGECIVSFIGHKTAVSCLIYENDSSRLASGGKDSEIVIWDVIDETGLFRLKGHKGPISKCLFYQPKKLLISSSKDTYIKFWDLDTQHCFYTLVGNQLEHRYTPSNSSTDINLDIVLIKGTKLICGLNGQKIRVWNIFVEENDDSSDSPVTKKLKANLQEQHDLNLVLDEGLMRDENEEIYDSKFKSTEVGELSYTENKAASIIVDPTERIIAVHYTTFVTPKKCRKFDMK